MVWTEVEIDRIVSNDHLRAAWADVFGLNIDQARLWMTSRRATHGGTIAHDSFLSVVRNQVTFHSMYGSLAQHKSVPTDPVAAVRTLCAILGCRALISDDDPNPYRWRLVEADKSIRLVRVDPRQLDETGAFVLVPETTEAAA